MNEIKKEALQVIYQDNKAIGVVHFSSKCRHRVFYGLEEMGDDEIENLFKKGEII